MLDVNLEAVVRIDEALLAAAVLRDYGRVICLSSISGMRPVHAIDETGGGGAYGFAVVDGELYQQGAKRRQQCGTAANLSRPEFLRSLFV